MNTYRTGQGMYSQVEADQDVPQDVVDADDAVRPRGPTVVHDGRVALHPHPAAVLRQEPIVLGRHLALVQYWKTHTFHSEHCLLTEYSIYTEALCQLTLDLSIKVNGIGP